MSVLRRLFAVRSVESIVHNLDAAPPLKRVLTARSLTAIGLGSTIGTGIFVFTGQVAAQNAGPALTIALLISALGAGLAAISYAEFAAMIPVSGSAYSYTYATLGESIAWFIGWNLSLEYLMSASAVAVSWSAYVVSLLEKFGLSLPEVPSTTARETQNPQRDVPIGILAALVISAILYIAMATVMTGMVSYTLLDVPNPVAVALDAHPQLSWLGYLVEIGIIIGMTSVILMSLIGQPRILLAMAEDGLLPARMAGVHPRHRTPHVATAVTIVIAALVAGLFPLDVLGELIVIGILLAFAVVCIGVLVLRHTKPDAERPFRVPFAPVTCVLGALLCGGLTYFLRTDTWWRLLVWTIIGFSIYGLYGYRHSRMRAEGR